MNIFRGIRLGVWGIILAACITVSGLYLAVFQTFLSPQGLTTIISESRLAETVRNDVLLPKILQTTRASDYATLLDDKTVTAAFNDAVSVETLNKKLEPAAVSLQKWLNSQEPSVTFRIDMSDISDSFAGKLAEKVNEKYAELPACTLRNTLMDVETGVCKSSLVTSETLGTKIKELVSRDSSLQENATLTPESIGLSAALAQVGNDTPTFLNLLYAAAIITGGIALLTVLWLLFKHRVWGVITIGTAMILSGLALYIVAIIGVQTVKTLSYDPQLLQIIRAGTEAVQAALQRETTILVLTGVLLIVIAGGIKLFITKRSRSKQSMHLSSE